MALPDFQQLMLPLLQYLADGKEHPNREVLDTLADQFNLTEEERKELLPSGQDYLFRNRPGREPTSRVPAWSTIPGEVFLSSPNRAEVCWPGNPKRSILKFCTTIQLTGSSGIGTKSRTRIPK